MPDAPPPYIRMYKPKRPNLIVEPEFSSYPTATLEIETIHLVCHRVVGLSVMFAYWPDSWQDDWAIEELLKWEGREDEIRRDQYYADFIVDENQQARPNERHPLEFKSIRDELNGIFVVHESIREPHMDSGTDARSGSEPDDILRLERGVSGGHEADLSRKDDA